MEVPQGKTDQNRERNSSPGEFKPGVSRQQGIYDNGRSRGLPESLVEPHDWNDITDGPDEPPLLRGNFSKFHPVKRLRSKSASDSNEPVTKLRSSSRCQYARFFTCLCKTYVPGHFGLRIFCYPPNLHYDVNQRISRFIVPYIGEGTSLEPICGEEKILVSLSEAIIPQGSEEKKALEFVRFRENEVYDIGGEVCLRGGSVPKVKFYNQSQILLCNTVMALTSQVLATFDHEKGSNPLCGISAQSVGHSIVEHPNSESSSYSPVAASDLVKTKGPSDDKLEDFSLQLGDKWEELGRRLGFNQAEITNFNELERQPKKKALNMLMNWRQKEGSNATYKVLYDALCDKKVQCKLLAEQFCCHGIVGDASS